MIDFGFTPIEFHQPHINFTHEEDSWQQVFEFDNGYGASVIFIPGLSYGSTNGRFELAVLDTNGRLTYDTSITDDALDLSAEEVTETLGRIAALSIEEPVAA